MVNFNIEKLLKKKKKSKYWLCQKMDITSKNLNRVINGETSSISFKYLEEFCKYLDCTIDELINIEKDAWFKSLSMIKHHFQYIVFFIYCEKIFILQNSL